MFSIKKKLNFFIDNEIGLDGVRALTDSLIKNTTLTTLHLGSK